MGHSTVVRDFYAAGGPVADDATLAATFAADYVSHTSPPGLEPGVGQAVALRGFLRATFDDIEYELIRLVEDGDLVAAHTRMSATHTGDAMGFPPTGRSFSAEQMHFLRFDGGKVAEHWAVRDDMAMMRQLGVIPAPSAA